VGVIAENGSITVTVSDDGKGIDPGIMELRPESIGVGIGGMRQRVTELGGRLRLDNANPGTIVEVVIPVSKTQNTSRVSVSA
jgi:signal transduction histidine kinase